MNCLSPHLADPVVALRKPVASCQDGLASAIDLVAARALPSHRFLRRSWYEAALLAYGGNARTIVITDAGRPMAALPFVRVGPAPAGLAAVPGCYWPFRSFPVTREAGPPVAAALLDCLGANLRALRIGPIYDGDPALGWLKLEAQARGWAVIDRFVADSYLLDMARLRAEGAWPRNSTLRKNRFHEKHLGSHGAVEWQFVSGEGWDEATFAALALTEEKSWLADRTDLSDAKFSQTGHGLFWRAAAADPVLAQMMWAAMLRIDGRPAAFSFDLNAGPLKYAIANSYDPVYGKHSPGKVLYYRNLVRALEDGMALVDWGAGDMGYKRTIGAAKGPAIRDWLFVRPGICAQAARMLANVWRNSGNRPVAAKDNDAVALAGREA